MKQMTEAELRKIIEDAYTKGWEDGDGFGNEEECKKRYVDQVLGTI